MLLLILPSLGVGGTERQVEQFLRTIDENREIDPASVIIVTLRRLDDGALRICVPSSIKHICLNSRSTFGVGAAWRLRKIVERYGVNVVYALLTPSIVAGSLLRLVSPIRLFWGFRTTISEPARRLSVSSIRQTALRYLSSASDGIVCNSYLGASSIGVLVDGKSPIHIVLNSVDPSKFFKSEVARLAGRQNLGTTSDETLLISIGRLDPDKDHRTLLRAFRSIREVKTEAILVIVGHGSGRAKRLLFDDADELGIRRYVRHIDQYEEMNEIYNSADLIIQSSQVEGLSNVLLEALSAGSQIVSTDCGDARYFLEHRCLAEVRNPQHLARVALEQLSCPGMIKLATSDLSPSRMVKETLKILGLSDNGRLSEP